MVLLLLDALFCPSSACVVGNNESSNHSYTGRNTDSKDNFFLENDETRTMSLVLLAAMHSGHLTLWSVEMQVSLSHHQ